VSCSRATSSRLLCLFVLITAFTALAQDTGNQAVGLPANGTFQGSDIDVVQLNNGNLHIEIPLYTLSGRGLAVPVKYVYDSKGWYEYSQDPVGGAPVYVYPQGVGPGGKGVKLAPFNNMTWTLAAPLSNGTAFAATYPLPNCTDSHGMNQSGKTANFLFKEPNGTGHSFPPFFLTSQNGCGIVSPTLVAAKDGSGYTILLDSNQNATAVVAKDGTRIYDTLGTNGLPNAVIMEDRNGNQLTRSVSSGVVSSNLVDTLGRSINTTPTLNTGTGKYELKYYDATGTQQTIQITMTSVPLHTNLCPYQNTPSDGVCNEYVATAQAPSVIQLPNGQEYVMTYVQNSDGQLASLEIPTGATISYTWGSTAGTADDAGPKVTSRTIISGGVSQTWTYNYGTAGPNPPPNTGALSVRDPAGNDTVHYFAFEYDTSDPENRTWEVETDSFSGPASSGPRLKTVKTTYQNPYTLGPVLPTSITTTWDAQGGLSSRIEKDYDNFTQSYVALEGWGNVIEEREFGFGTGGAYGSLVRKTDYQYAHISGNTGYNVNYLNRAIADLVTQKTVYDGSANKLSDSKTVYDAAVSTTTGVPNHNSAVGSYRGNATQSSVWLNTNNTWLNTNNTYNDLGHVLTTQDPGLHTTSFSYTDSWATTGVVYNCATGTNTQAYLTQTSAPDTVNSQGATVHHRAQTIYFPCTGQKQATLDENDILAARAGTTYTYDLMLRPSTVTHTDGGTTTMSYGDTANAISVTSTTKQDATHNLISTSYHDGLGRVKQTQLVDTNNGDTFVDTTYDLMGRVSTVSNPHRTATAPTDGITTYQYDALGRKILEIPPDGTSSSNKVDTAYGAQTTAPIGLTTTVTDQAGKKRMSVTDALGRLVDVWEPSASSNTLVNETLYSYDLLNNLLRVDQKGNTTNTALWRTRTSTYDSLSRLLTTTNPESGIITWTYDVDSNVLTKKDARNNTITYNYDQLHRVATVGATHAKSYSNGDPAVDYFFDQTAYNGLTITEGVNHQTGMADATGTSASTFDSEGRVLSENQTVNITGVTTAPVTKALTYTYKLDGSMASLTYPSGHVINYAYNDAGRPTNAIDPSGPIKYVTSTNYAPHGDVANYVNGLTTAFAGIKLTNAWNNRFQPQSFVAATLGTGAHNVMSLAFSFNQGTVGAPIDNGMLVKITNSVSTGRSTNYSYDQLNRIVAGWHDAADWGTQYTVDIWGNLSQKAPCNNTVGCPTRTMGEGFSAGVNGNNQFVGYSYDASGNLQNDQLGHTFVYDAENRPKSETTGTTTVSYYYDGIGERVAKSNGKLYWFGTNSAPLVESDATGAITNEYIFFGGKRVALRRASDNTAHYYFADQIGSANVVTSATGTVEQDIEYHPYGEQQVYTDTLGQQYKFTGREHDSETNNDYFGARYYSSTFGRFLTPDWSATPEAIPYAVMGNPQTLNLYSYVENNPITGIDPDGHDDRCRPGTCKDPVALREDAKKTALKAQQPQQNKPAQQTQQQTQSTQQKAEPQKGGGVLLTVTGAADAGVGKAGATVQASAGAGGFINSNGHPSLGAEASGAAMANAGEKSVGVPKQDNDSGVIGLFAGVGVGATFTNAGNATAMKSMSNTASMDFGWGPAASISVSSGHGLWSVTIDVGPGWGFAVSKTNTATAAVSTPQ